MTILIVDDDAHMVRSIQKNVDWAALGIDTVHTAGSARQAKGVLDVYDVDVLLSDIEMPQQNGLDLLAWVRESGHEVQAVFLTSYANFEYARRAISLQSVEYFLKPVDYELLTGGLSRAIERARLTRESRLNRDLSDRWARGQGEVVAHFWRQVLGGLFHGDAAALQSHLSGGLLPYTMESRFVPVVIRSFGRAEASLAEIESGLRARCEALIPVPDSLCGAYALTEAEWLLLLDAGGMPERLWIDLTAQVSSWLGVELLLGLGGPCFIHELYQQAQDLREMLMDCVSPRPTPLYLRDWERRDPGEATLPDEALKQLLSDADLAGFEREALRHLATMGESGPVYARTLRLLRLDLTQLVYARLEQAGLQARALFSDEESERLYAQAAASTSGMAAYISHLSTVTARHIPSSHRRESGIVDRLVEYIDANFMREISRSELSKSVYLNQDYISRLFKRETGQSISGYIIHKRMSAAKELLRRTDTPIHMIASQVGYDSFAYFSKIFKQTVGVAPNEYRRNAR